MGTGDYTRRSVKLQNLGEVRRVELPDLSATARASERLGRSVAGFGRDVANGALRLIGDLSAIKEEKEQRELAIDAVEIKKMWRQRMMNGKDGYMLRSGVNADGMSAEAGEAFENDILAVAGEKSEEHQTKLRLMLAGQLNSMMGTLSVHEAKELKASSIRAADSLVKSDAADWAAGLMTEETLQSAVNNKNHALQLHEELSDGEKLIFDRDWAESRYADIINQESLNCAEEGDYTALIEKLEKEPEFFVESFPTLKEELSVFKGEDGSIIRKELIEGLVGKIKKARLHHIGEKEYAKREALREVKDKFVRKELELIEKDLPQTAFMAEYEKMGSDPILKALSPETALQYLETARKMERAIEKHEADATEESLSRRLTWNLFRQTDGRYDEGKIAADQAAIWRDYKTALMAGNISDNFARSFHGRLRSNLSEQEAKAMRRFYSSFGYLGELNSEGEVPFQEQKHLEKTSFAVPEDPANPREEKPRIKGVQLFSLGESFLLTLRELGAEAYRPEVMDKVISNIKGEWHYKDFERNRRERVQDILDIQRNFMAKEGIKNGKESTQGIRGKSGVRDGVNASKDKSGN